MKGTALPRTAQHSGAGKVLPKGTRWHLGNGRSDGSVLQDWGSAVLLRRLVQRGLFNVIYRETGFPGASYSPGALSPSIAMALHPENFPLLPELRAPISFQKAIAELSHLGLFPRLQRCERMGTLAVPQRAD